MGIVYNFAVRCGVYTGCVVSPAIDVKNAQLRCLQSKNQRKLEHCKSLLELFSLITMNFGLKMYPPSCASRRRHMTMACGRITNFPSCVARQPLWRMIMVCDHNITQASHGARIYDVFLHSDEQNRADEASKYSRSIPHLNKSGNRSILLHYATKTCAQCPDHISINASGRCNYETNVSGIVSRITNSSCSIANVSFKSAEKTEPVKKKLPKGNETENHLEFLFTEL